MTTDARLRGAGLRVTRARLAVLDVLEHPGHERHLAVADLLTRVREQLPGTSTQTVYDCVEALTTARLVRRVQLPGFPARYEAVVEEGDNHHHLVCRRCGATVDVACAVGTAPCLRPVAAHGYAVDEAEVVFWGLCPTCLRSASSTSSTQASTEASTETSTQTSSTTIHPTTERTSR